MAAVIHEIGSISSEQSQGLDIRRDYDLLLKFLRRGMSGDGTLGSLCISATSVCWPRLLTLARHHEVLPLLRSGLRGVSGVPAPMVLWLDTHCRTAVGHNLSLASELIGLLQLFEERQLTAIPFKGPAWTMALYGSLATRQMADLDLFIERDQARQIFGLLAELGYELSGKFKIMSSEEIRLGHKDIELVHPESGITLELHWSACEPWFDQRLSRLKFWEPASSTKLLNRAIPIPSPEHMVFLLALHGLRHRWESLKWICDIDAAVRAFPDLDWAAVLSQAGKLSRKRMVLLPLALIEALFGTRLPACVATAIGKDPAVASLAAQLIERHLADSNGGYASSENEVCQLISRETVRLYSREKFIDRLALSATLLFNMFKPTANDRKFLTARTLPEALCWAIRPIRLLNTYGAACLLRLTRQLIAPLCRV